MVSQQPAGAEGQETNGTEPGESGGGFASGATKAKTRRIGELSRIATSRAQAFFQEMMYRVYAAACPSLKQH